MLDHYRTHRVIRHQTPQPSPVAIQTGADLLHHLIGTASLLRRPFRGEYFCGIGTDLGLRVTVMNTRGKVLARIGRESYGEQSGRFRFPSRHRHRLQRRPVRGGGVLDRLRPAHGPAPAAALDAEVGKDPATGGPRGSQSVVTPVFPGPSAPLCRWASVGSLPAGRVAPCGCGGWQPPGGAAGQPSPPSRRHRCGRMPAS